MRYKRSYGDRSGRAAIRPGPRGDLLMSSFAKRSTFLVCVGAISVPLVAAALAYGCTAVATLAAGQSAARAGTAVAVTGKYFGPHDPATDNTNGLAEIRLGSLTGPV